MVLDAIPNFAEILGKSVRGDVAGSGSEHTTTDCGRTVSKTRRILTLRGAQTKTIELRIVIIYSGVRQARHKVSYFKKIKIKEGTDTA